MVLGRKPKRRHERTCPTGVLGTSNRKDTINNQQEDRKSTHPKDRDRNRQRGRKSDIATKTERHRHNHRQTDRKAEADRHKNRDRQGGRKKVKDRQTERVKRETDGKRHMDKETVSGIQGHTRSKQNVSNCPTKKEKKKSSSLFASRFTVYISGYLGEIKLNEPKR